MSLAVSLCVLRIETSDEPSEPGMTSQGAGADSVGGNDDCVGAMAAERDMRCFVRGRRGNHEITIETYARADGERRPIGILSGNKAQAEIPSEARGSCEPEDADVAPKPKDQINFVSGNPFVEVTKGILHLFKEDELTHVDRAVQRSQTVCILAVPATMTCHDLLTFTAACHADIQHLRIIRDGAPNRYMALLTFRTQQSASEFYTTFNGAPFNSLDPACCCHLVFVSRVEVGGGGGLLPPPGHTELPTCPVCLERMDESVDGVLTILCNHAFHGNCLAKWGDTSCPVCRYVQTPEVVEDNECFECHSADGLWICLVCGHVGCGRYVRGHASEHYLNTQHCYSMQLGSNRVWDYVGDNFVHRLLQNKGDGKLVEGGGGLAKQDCEEKLDSVQLEFTYLLTSQLDSQRRYFEDQMARVENSSTTETAALREKAVVAAEENQALQRKISALGREKTATEKKLQQVSSKLAAVLSDLQDERQMGKALQQNQGEWRDKLAALETKFADYKREKDAELVEVKDQLRDVMFSLEAQRQIWESEDRAEISQGRITVGEPAPPPGNSRGHRRKKR